MADFFNLRKSESNPSLQVGITNMRDLHGVTDALYVGGGGAGLRPKQGGHSQPQQVAHWGFVYLYLFI